MGLIINPRGPSGSGKTEFARRIARAYGLPRSGRIERIYRNGRERPIAYRLDHPAGGSPLMLLGHYERTCGGCDTIRLADGGLEEAFRLAREYAASGHDVLFEGLLLSAEQTRSAILAAAHELHVLHLDTPVDRCIRNVMARRHAGKRSRGSAARIVRADQANIREACRRLQEHAIVEVLDFDRALRRSRQLLGLDPLPPADPVRDDARRSRLWGIPSTPSC